MLPVCPAGLSQRYPRWLSHHCLWEQVSISFHCILSPQKFRFLATLKVITLLLVGSQNARCPSVTSGCHHPLMPRRRLERARMWRWGRLAYSLLFSLSLCLTLFLSCQIFSRANDQEPSGWWLAKVRMIKGDVSILIYCIVLSKLTWA